MLKAFDRGDSIIEVLLAITVFSMVSIATMTIMNQGTNTSQRALEITLVRQQIDAQAEAIRAVQQAATSLDPAAVAAWRTIAVPGSDTAVHSAQECPTAAPSGTFIMDASKAVKMGGPWFNDVNGPTAPPYAQVVYAGAVAQGAYGMWVERDAESVGAGFRPAFSFAINACWNGAGSSNVPQRLRTVVRLYDPL